MISQNEIRNRALAFSHEWDRECNEDAEAKSFWDGFFDVFGVSRRRVASFEHRVKKQDGSNGYIDVLWKGVMLAEHKTRGKSLDKAFTQAKEYFPGLKDSELPRFLIVSDFARIRVYDLDADEQHEFGLTDFHKHIELFDFVSGYVTPKYEEQEEVSIKAAELMADFHNEIAKTGYSGHALEVFLIRVLFCLFADNTGIFEKGLWRNYLETRISADGSDLGLHISQIFYVLNTPLDKRQSTLDEQLWKFPYVNGGIFAEPIPPVSLDATAHLKLLKCTKFDWSGISASIFGSLFQGVMGEQERRQLGAHYTSEKNILRLIHPLFLDELYIEFDRARHDKKKLEAFHQKLSTLTFLDPACGCGNFLVVSYRELRKLELEILLVKKKDEQMMLVGVEDLSLLNVNQFYGIEVEEFPALVARVAMYLVDHQMNNLLSEKFGQAYARLPLREPATIVFADALTTNWEDVLPKERCSYILGNPPFVGARLMEKTQKEAFLALFDSMKGAGNLDFVTAWYEKASRYMQGTMIRTAFVSTNSICQGEQVGILWKRLKEKYSIVIHFAHQTFKWNNDAPGVAAVYCIIVGFACFDAPKKYLYEYETIKGDPKEKEVAHINAYLVAGEDVFLENRTESISSAPKINYGSFALDDGNYTLSESDKDDIIKSNPLAEKYTRLFIGGRELLHNEKRYCLWLKGADPTELKQIPLIIERIEKVKAWRQNSERKNTVELAKTPTLFAEIRQPETAYIAFPTVSSENREYIPIAYLDKNTIASNQVYIIADASLFDFAILESSMHMTWVSYICGRLKSDYRYSSKLVYNNFPWPDKLSKEQEKKVEECAQKVLGVRTQFSNSSLADLYDPNTMPPELVKAHADLDHAVDVCYGKKFSNKEERIEHLFERYKKLTSQ